LNRHSSMPPASDLEVVHTTFAQPISLEPIIVTR
jgi:hypothetical protein